MPVLGTIKMTADRFLMLGEDPPGVRLELVEGEIAVSPSPIPSHSYTLVSLISILKDYTRSRRLGTVFTDVDTLLDEYNIRRPDILYFSNERMHLVGEKHMEGPPDLAVEIISPGSIEVDREVKFEQYAQAGVMHYWLVDPAEKTFESFVLRKGEYCLVVSGSGDESVSPDPFSALLIPLAELWFPRR